MDFLAQFKKVTHALALGGGAALAWAVSDQGRQIIGAVVHAYPKASFLTGLLAFFTILYHSPKQ